jgi:hypothetical protein
MNHIPGRQRVREMAISLRRGLLIIIAGHGLITGFSATPSPINRTSPCDRSQFIKPISIRNFCKLASERRCGDSERLGFVIYTRLAGMTRAQLLTQIVKLNDRRINSERNYLSIQNALWSRAASETTSRAVGKKYTEYL